MKHFDDFKLFLKRLRKTAHVICLSETRLNEQNMKTCHLSGYNDYFCNSKTRAGGSAIYLSAKLKCQHLPQIKIKSYGCEDVWIELQFDNQDSLIVALSTATQMTTKKGFKIFEEAFVKIIKSFKANQKFEVEGDFNADYDNNNSSQTISNYTNHINRVGCSQLVD